MKTLLTAALVLLIAAPAQANGNDLHRYGKDTWHSFTTMVDPGTGLPADNVTVDGQRSNYTSPTNIGAYLWSTLAARDIGVISDREAKKRLAKTLASTAKLERSHGHFFNWYDPATGARRTDMGTPFLSSVDNGWLGAALLMVERGEPSLKREARAISSGMNFGFYYDPEKGQLWGGAWTEKPEGCSEARNGLWFTCHRYGAFNTEPRITSYLGIAQGTIPPEHYFRMLRTLADDGSCGQEQDPEGENHSYLGVDVYEGHYSYRGIQVVPTWGGSMFEALMVPLLVPEEEWGKRSWGLNHPRYVRAQIEHGLNEAKYGYWGFSPANKPEGGYDTYGVDAIGMQTDGYYSDDARTDVVSCPAPVPPPAFGNGVVTPHASFLALRYAPRESLANLEKLRRTFPAIYGAGGFRDSINVGTGVVSDSYLALDQGMVMAAIGNALTRDRLRSYLEPALERKVRPVMAMERFSIR